MIPSPAVLLIATVQQVNQTINKGKEHETNRQSGAAMVDYTTLDRDTLGEAARLQAQDLRALSRPGFAIRFYDTLEDFNLAQPAYSVYPPPLAACGGKWRST